MSRAYYNENNAHAAAWLRELIREGFIAPGDVDDRSINDVHSDDLHGYTQCHFFAGIGVWSYSLRNAGWPDDREVWTGSAPCQPFSQAGKQLGESDPRHLWPDFFQLIDACRPARLFGEQVSGKAGYGWLDGVTADLENKDYACWAFDIPACAVDAPHIRNRLYWGASIVEHSALLGRRERWTESELRSGWSALAGANASSDVGHANDPRLPLRQSIPGDPRAKCATAQRTNDGTVSFWADAEWVTCHDGKARRTKRGLPLLVAGAPGRISMWRALGNAINAPLAIEVIKAFMESEQ